MRPMRVLVIVLEVILIFVASSALIRYVVSKPTSARDATEIKFGAANGKKFRSLYDTGSKQLQNSEYPEALASFQEAEQSSGQLSDDQYTALKNARLKIATYYESSGRTAEAEAVYQTLQTSALQEGYVLSRAHVPAQALPRLQDAQQFSEHLTEGKQAALVESSGAVVECFREMQQFDDAEENSHQMIDYLRASSSPSDLALPGKYMELAETYSQANRWDLAEQTLVLAWPNIDQVIAHRSNLPDNDPSLMQALSEKDLLLSWLVNAYAQDGKIETALATSEALYSYVADHSKPWGDLGPYGRKQVAAQAITVALKANRPDLAARWQARLSTFH
ncbi:MAG TPA: hypothetical protein VN875_17430 [Candidatus Binatus sp.]|jgi:hypothetical protein|nr:hypothetical protein [Candidatus Binatus sp.]